ncbi:hypothetical protein MKZ02_20005 [Pseudobacillus sp. FSL P4-0506]|uniref:hypothetical protein n=1 Tax=Pseudobacillus sp. FSL P4-0506 TaxID=2921576 RepID=UPI0030F73C90
MKALTREELITAINANFNEGEIVFQNDGMLDKIFEQLGHDYFIENNRWERFKTNPVWEEKK